MPAIVNEIEWVSRDRQGAPDGQGIVIPRPTEWAVQQWGELSLPDARLHARAVAMGAKMAARPSASLPAQMEGHAELWGAYRLLSNPRVTMSALLANHEQNTLGAASKLPLVLMVEDTTELDYTHRRTMKGLGPIGNGNGQGLLLHSTLAIVPEGRQVLGLAHAQVVLRVPTLPSKSKWTGSAEGRLWENSAKAVGQPPEGVTWVHVSDRGSDDFAYMAACRELGKHFLIRVQQNRRLLWQGEAGQETEGPKLKDYVRSLPAEPGGGYSVRVDATDKHPAREAQVVLAWARVTIPPPEQGSDELRSHAPIEAWVLRVWEPNPPPGAEAVEWILLSSLPIQTVQDAHQKVDWYCCRWFCEDYHQCLKTGCRVEHTQLDDGDDVRRLLGFLAPIAVHLLQLQQAARQSPDLPAHEMVDPFQVEMLALRLKKDAKTMTVGAFWRGVAQLGGHQGRKGDGPPGWRTIWTGWCKLSDLTEGARMYARHHPPNAPVRTTCVERP